MESSPEILDKLVKEHNKPEDILRPEGILKQLTKALAQRSLNAEMEVYVTTEQKEFEV